MTYLSSTLKFLKLLNSLLVKPLFPFGKQLDILLINKLVFVGIIWRKINVNDESISFQIPTPK